MNKKLNTYKNMENYLTYIQILYLKPFNKLKMTKKKRK